MQNKSISEVAEELHKTYKDKCEELGIIGEKYDSLIEEAITSMLPEILKDSPFEQDKFRIKVTNGKCEVFQVLGE